MSHSDLNPVNPAKPKRAAIVISNAAVSTSTGWPVGFWWSELTHPHYAFSEAGWQVDIYSPDGGDCTWDAMSDPDDQSRWQAEDQISRGYKNDPMFRTLVENTRPIADLDVDAYDVLVVAGVQGPMFTSPTRPTCTASSSNSTSPGRSRRPCATAPQSSPSRACPTAVRWSRARPSPASPTSRRMPRTA